MVGVLDWQMVAIKPKDMSKKTFWIMLAIIFALGAALAFLLFKKSDSPDIDRRIVGIEEIVAKIDSANLAAKANLDTLMAIRAQIASVMSESDRKLDNALKSLRLENQKYRNIINEVKLRVEEEDRVWENLQTRSFEFDPIHIEK
jgi:hypothetical protein